MLKGVRSVVKVKNLQIIAKYIPNAPPGGGVLSVRDRSQSVTVIRNIFHLCWRDVYPFEARRSHLVDAMKYVSPRHREKNHGRRIFPTRFANSRSRVALVMSKRKPPEPFDPEGLFTSTFYLHEPVVQGVQAARRRRSRPITPIAISRANVLGSGTGLFTAGGVARTDDISPPPISP